MRTLRACTLCWACTEYLACSQCQACIEFEARTQSQACTPCLACIQGQAYAQNARHAGPWSTVPRRWTLVHWSQALDPSPELGPRGHTGPSCPLCGSKSCTPPPMAMQAVLGPFVAMQAILAPCVASQAFIPPLPFSSPPIPHPPKPCESSTRQKLCE